MSSKLALCLAGGGISGAMYQIGALAAVDDVIDGADPSAFDLYVGVASGATLAAALAGGAPIQRIYRALLDPADDYFPFRRQHLLRMDLDEWRRTLVTAWEALGHGSRTLLARGPAPSPHEVWEQLDRFYDSLPAGLFTLDSYERFLEDFFVRRGIPNSFRGLARELRIPAYDLDRGERVIFGSEGEADVPISLAVTASMALPLFFSPVRIGNRHFIDGSLGATGHVDLATGAGADIIVVVNPMAPIRIADGNVPTGHGRQQSVRDKGMMWVYDQAMRIAASGRLDDRLEHMGPRREQVLLLGPRASDAPLFLHNHASFAHRRAILEFAYRTTRERIGAWVEAHPEACERAGWKIKR
jgi:predicted acylesterase/phospholipase RssA